MNIKSEEDQNVDLKLRFKVEQYSIIRVFIPIDGIILFLSKNIDVISSQKRKMGKKDLQNLGPQSITSSKAAQTQLKTSLRNHIDLSAIADNKANIMLSINAIVITVGLPLMAERLADNGNYIYPMLVLGLSSMISMAYATLSTRPIKTHGTTTLETVKQGKSNLFFFGNFYKMNIDEYEVGMKEVVEKNDLLESSITRDLFFLGKSLGVKFDQLRICYNIFMVGMTLTVLLFVLISFMNH